jgi:hypothetical protein
MLLAALAALMLMPSAALADDPGTEAITTGPVTATLSWDGDDHGVVDGRLQITRAGVSAFDAPIPDVVCDHCTLLGNGADDIKISDLEGDGEPEVVVVGYTGGIHCCTRIGIYSYNADKGAYEELDYDYGPTGFELVDIDGDGDVEILSSDPRFDQLFAPHIYSFPPPQVSMFLHQDGVPVLVDDTTGYPDPIMTNAAEAKRHLARRHFQGGASEARAYIAAYVADQYLLSQGSVGRRELDKQIRRGVLGRPDSARAFKARLMRLLRHYGYA